MTESSFLGWTISLRFWDCSVNIMGLILGRLEIKLEKASTHCCSVFLNVCSMNNLPNAQSLVCLSTIFLSTPWHFAVLPLILQPTSSPYKNQASWWLSSYRILQIEHYPVWPFQAWDLEASPGKQNMLKWVLIHPGRHATHREMLRNSWENVWQTHLEL